MLLPVLSPASFAECPGQLLCISAAVRIVLSAHCKQEKFLSSPVLAVAGILCWSSRLCTVPVGFGGMRRVSNAGCWLLASPVRPSS